MKTYIYSNNSNIQSNQSLPSMPYVSGTFSQNATGTAPGSVRYNGSRNCFEVSDGNSWIGIPDTATNLDLSPEVQSVLSWARRKMAEESQLDHLMSKYPALKDAYDQYQVVKHLVTHENNT